MASDRPTSCDSKCAVLILSVIIVFCPISQQLQSSQVQTLLRIRKLLEFPNALKGWNNNTDFCNLAPSSSLTVVCYEDSITQLQVVGDKGFPSAKRKWSGTFTASNKTLASNFSVDSFATTLYKLSGLKVLSLVSLGLWGPLPGKIARLSSLEILNVSSNFLHGAIPVELSSLRNLQTLILDNNMFNGTVPEWLSALPSLSFLSLKNNSLNGPVPTSLSTIQSLRVVDLSGNRLSGDVPDLTSLTNLQVLDLQGNKLGPFFPTLGNKLVTLVLRKNKIAGRIPSDLGSFYQLQQLDLSSNALIGPPPAALFSLPVLRYMNLARNSLSGTLPQNLICSSTLKFVDLSSNFLTGNLPSCLGSQKTQERIVEFGQNCLAIKLQHQNPNSYCQNAAIATGVNPRISKQSSRAEKITIALSIVGGLVGVMAALGLLFLLLLRRYEGKEIAKKSPGKSVAENSSTGLSSDLLTNTRYISQTMRLGALGLPQYRPFALEELEEATRNFSRSAFMGEGAHGKLYRGRLEDGTLVAIRCLKFEWRHGIQSLKLQLELLSKLRHRHLVSLLGHCIDCEQDGSGVKRIFLIFEYVSNGTLRSNLSGRATEELLNWHQRLAAVIGVAKGIHFLHTGVVPGIFHNDLKATNVLLDQSLVAKVSDYGLPILGDDMEQFEANAETHHSVQNEPRSLSRRNLPDKVDIYNFGLILLESIIGRSPSMQSQAEDTVQGMVSLLSDQMSRRQLVDPVIARTCVDESLETVIEITAKCLLEEAASRPSMEDVLWNLQYAAQVQDTSSSGDLPEEDSPDNFPVGLKSSNRKEMGTSEILGVKH